MKRAVFGFASCIALAAQTPPACPVPDGVSRYCVMLTIHNGLTRRDGDSTLSPGSVSLPAGTRERLDKYLDKALPALGKPYMVILTEEDRQKADAGTLVNENLPILRDANLSLAKYAEFLQAWCDDYADCQASAAIVLSPAGLYRDFAKYQDAPLIFEADDSTGLSLCLGA